MSVDKDEIFRRLIESRRRLVQAAGDLPTRKSAEEGGCGVVGFACSEPVRGRHIFEPSIQMHNRGNGKGGGIAAACLEPSQLGVDERTLRESYLLQIALLDPSAENEIEQQAISPSLEISHQQKIETVGDHREVGLEVKPPEIVRYFVRARQDALERFAAEHGLEKAEPRAVEDELIFQNSARLNRAFYASLGEKKGFVMSHARNLMIFKIVGYAEQVVQFYRLEDLKARIWIAHQRYPTKGRVWHPAGSHPFIGLNEALVHNGDFANYYSVCEYLRSHNLIPQFLTDTEVSVLLFDLWSRVYGYPLEYVIEAMAPTTELDFDRLPPDKREIYRMLQALHLHGSPDGPWFFIIAHSQPDLAVYRLLGITDTAMLRPQVFALQEGEVEIGLVASEKQAIDATLSSLHAEDPRFRLVADRYWNARGGSHTDGGAFSFTLTTDNGTARLACADKFGNQITAPPGEHRLSLEAEPKAPPGGSELWKSIGEALSESRPETAFARFVEAAPGLELDHLRWLTDKVVESAGPGRELPALELLTLINDRRFDLGSMRRSSALQVMRAGINRLLDSTPRLNEGGASGFRRIDFQTRDQLRAPGSDEKILVIFARDFPPEGDDCDARLAVEAYQLGWRRFVVYGLKGQRFHGCGLGPDTRGVRFDIYGSSGDYLGSGIDGLELHVHDNGQDQLAQIMKQGELVIHGDVGQAFMYGAKGGSVFVLGNAAGRPLINAVGRPRVVINGTCLDFLAESFMAGDPHNGGGFVILNGIEFDDRAKVRGQSAPYPGSNLFSLASGGAIFVRDPHRKLVKEQLNGGEFAELSDRDWALIRPLLEANERHFGISIEQDLLTVDGEKKSPAEVYRKVRAVELVVLAKMQPPE